MIFVYLILALVGWGMIFGFQHLVDTLPPLPALLFKFTGACLFFWACVKIIRIVLGVVDA